MEPNLWSLYRQMLRSRRFEERVKGLWAEGKIFGEMHLGIGEEAIAAGVISHLQEGDAIALDHRCTPPLVIRGIDLVLLLKEFLGKVDGLCSGMGGHMHLFSREYLAASSGIVGSPAPLAAGFALAARYLRPGNMAVSFFGEGAINQGMLLETLNLAVVWKLPLLFVCKDNQWAITTRSHRVIAGSITDRAKSFGMPAPEVDGTDVEAVWNAARQGIDSARNGDGPTFLLARCPRLEGHFLRVEKPIDQVKELTGQLLRSLSATRGASLGERMASIGTVISLASQLTTDQSWHRRDPVERLRRRLKKQKTQLDEIEMEVAQEIEQAAEFALSS